MKELLSLAGVLKYPEFDKKFEVPTDVSDFAIGGVLMQYDHPIAFESWKLMGSPLRWPTHEKKLYVMVYCLKAWRYYVGGKKNEVVSGQHFVKVPQFQGASVP